jgi:hypothetical protein
MLSSDNLNHDLHKKYVAVLRKLCGYCLTLPKTRMLAHGLVRIGVEPRAGGQFTDLWEGVYLKEKKVAIKVLRTYALGGSNTLIAADKVKKVRLLWISTTKCLT